MKNYIYDMCNGKKKKILTEKKIHYEIIGAI